MVKSQRLMSPDCPRRSCDLAPDIRVSWRFRDFQKHTDNRHAKTEDAGMGNQAVRALEQRLATLETSITHLFPRIIRKVPTGTSLLFIPSGL
jgi:hypothetical protein